MLVLVPVGLRMLLFAILYIGSTVRRTMT